MEPDSETRPSFAHARWLFLRLLAIVYLIAFASLAVQITGLVGSAGILPATEYMNRARDWTASHEIAAAERFRLLPTLCWLSSGDGFLRGLCVAGVGFALLLLFGIAPLGVLPALWLTYLSLCVVGREFMSYQWDALLLETGFLAIFVAPAVWRERRGAATDPPRMSVWLMWWLLFRLMVGSGAVKLLSGDSTWRDLSALTFHYETQPLPTPLAWYAHQLPRAIQQLCAGGVFGIELVSPWFILAGRRARVGVCALLVALQVLLAATGNYTFFNILAASLCVWLLDDRAFGRLFAIVRPAQSSRSKLMTGVTAAGAVLVVPISLLAFTTSLGVILPGWRLVEPVAEWLAPFRTFNSYGLFAVMTTERDEIIVEGSSDGATWVPYEFKFKPGDLARRPPWVAPHQPRVDWQMWFAALDRYENEAWFQSFCRRLLEGSPSVLRLIGRNPFDRSPPKYIRASRYRYRFADWAGRSHGQWWTRTLVAPYSPILYLGASPPNPLARSRRGDP